VLQDGEHPGPHGARRIVFRVKFVETPGGDPKHLLDDVVHAGVVHAEVARKVQNEPQMGAVKVSERHGRRWIAKKLAFHEFVKYPEPPRNRQGAMRA
jgi:hypothetical protein